MAALKVKKTKSKKTVKDKSMGKLIHKKTTIDGITFDSKMESEFYIYLKEQKELGVVESFTLQPEFILQPKYFVYDNKVITYDNEAEYKEYDKLRKKYNKENPDDLINIVQAIKYKADFDVLYTSGERVIYDPKGVKTADFKIKEKMFKFRYPHLKLQCVILDKKRKSWVDFDVYQKSKKGKKKKNGEKQ